MTIYITNLDKVVDIDLLAWDDKRENWYNTGLIPERESDLISKTYDRYKDTHYNPMADVEMTEAEYKDLIAGWEDIIKQYEAHEACFLCPDGNYDEDGVYYPEYLLSYDAV